MEIAAQLHYELYKFLVSEQLEEMLASSTGPKLRFHIISHLPAFLVSSQIVLISLEYMFAANRYRKFSCKANFSVPVCKL